MPIAGDMPMMPSLSEREPVPGAVLEHVRLALAFALIATRIDEDEDVAEETEAPHHYCGWRGDYRFCPPS